MLNCCISWWQWSDESLDRMAAQNIKFGQFVSQHFKTSLAYVKRHYDNDAISLEDDHVRVFAYTIIHSVFKIYNTQ